MKALRRLRAVSLPQPLPSLIWTIQTIFRFNAAA
jgi:hypothetical protein